MYLSKTPIVYSEHAYIFSGTSHGILDADTCIAAQPPKKIKIEQVNCITILESHFAKIYLVRGITKLL